MHKISAFWRHRQDDSKFETSLVYKMRPYHQNQKMMYLINLLNILTTKGFLAFLLVDYFINSFILPVKLTEFFVSQRVSSINKLGKLYLIQMKLLSL
jgi:hypothetical protein